MRKRRNCNRPKPPRSHPEFEAIYYSKTLGIGNANDVRDIFQEIVRRGLKAYFYQHHELMVTFMVPLDDITAYPWGRHDGDGATYLLPMPDVDGESNGHWISPTYRLHKEGAEAHIFGDKPTPDSDVWKLITPETKIPWSSATLT